MAEHPTPHPDLAGYLFDILEPDEARAFEAHLGDCASCRREVDELDGLPVLLREEPAQLPADLQERTFARIAAEQHPEPVADAAPNGRRTRRLPMPWRPRPEPPASGRPEQRPPGPTRPGPRRRRHRLIGLAATVIVVLTAGVIAGTF